MAARMAPRMATRPYKLVALFILFAIGLTGCSTPAHDPLTFDKSNLTQPKQNFVPFEGGLHVTPDGREISFGRDWAGVEQTLTRSLGPPDVQSQCGRENLVLWGTLALRHNGHRFTGVGCSAPGA